MMFTVEEVYDWLVSIGQDNMFPGNNREEKLENIYQSLDTLAKYGLVGIDRDLIFADVDMEGIECRLCGALFFNHEHDEEAYKRKVVFHYETVHKDHPDVKRVMNT